MMQPRLGPLDESIGYALKQTATVLRSSMDRVLRPLGLTVPQYACLELLGQRPESSNADLARGMFVSRQSMNGVLQGLEERGLVTRPPEPERGRALPARLTELGSAQLSTASRAVRVVEQQMLAPLDIEQRHHLLSALEACRQALDQPQEPTARAD